MCGSDVTCICYYCNDYYVHRVYFISNNEINLTAWREITLITQSDTSSVTSLTSYVTSRFFYKNRDVALKNKKMSQNAKPK